MRKVNDLPSTSRSNRSSFADVMGRPSSLGMDAAWSRNSALQTVWGLLSSGFLPLLTTMKWWLLLIRQESGRGRDSGWILSPH